MVVCKPWRTNAFYVCLKCVLILHWRHFLIHLHKNSKLLYKVQNPVNEWNRIAWTYWLRSVRNESTPAGRNQAILSADLSHFCRLLLQVHGFTGGPAAFLALFAPGRGLQRGTCCILGRFCPRSRPAKGDLQHYPRISLQVPKREAVVTGGGMCFAHVVKETPSFEDVSLCGRWESNSHTPTGTTPSK